MCQGSIGAHEHCHLMSNNVQNVTTYIHTNYALYSHINTYVQCGKIIPEQNTDAYVYTYCKSYLQCINIVSIILYA